MAEVILWDLMDTIVRDPFFTHVADYLGMPFDRLLAEKDPHAWRDFELGRIDEAQLFARFFSDRRRFDGPGLKHHMLQSFDWIGGMQELLADLRAAGVPMYALSNYPCWVHEIDQRLGLSRYLTLSFVSCDTGARKPAEEAFLGALRHLGRPADQCLFIDDRRENCDAAERLGLPVIHFLGEVQPLRTQLQQQGLLR